jgi:AcrR family transcriptional regulator
MNERSFIYYFYHIMTRREDRIKQITKQRREQILDAALNVFSRKGFDKSTVPDIARQAGIAVGTIYNYYPSKRDLFVAAIAKFIIEPFAAVIKLTPQNGDADYISTIVENRLNIGLENVGHFLPLFSDIQRDPELRQRYNEQALQPVFGMMEKYYASRIKGRTFRNVNPAIVTRAIGGMVIGFMLLYWIEGESSPAHGINRKELAEELTGLILHGLEKK